MSQEVYFSEKITQESISKLREKIESIYEKDKSQEIVLYISSGGGFASAAISFFEWIRIKKVSLTTVAMGEVSSAAVTLFLAGERRKATTRSWFLIHPGGTLKGDLILFLAKIIPYRRFKEEKAWEEHVYGNVLIGLIKERTNIPEILVKNLTTKSFLLLDPIEAKRVGLVHEII